MTTSVSIGRYRKVPIHALKWTVSISEYCNSAEIQIPSVLLTTKEYQNGQEEPIEANVLSIGMPVIIACGYDGNNKVRFKGFICAINIQKNVGTISCEGFSYQLRKIEFARSYNNPTIKEILNDLIFAVMLKSNGKADGLFIKEEKKIIDFVGGSEEVSVPAGKQTRLELNKNIPDIQLKGSITFKQGETGISVLEYLQEKCGLTVSFINHNELYVGLKYVLRLRETKFRIRWNVIDADQLIFKEKQSRKVAIIQRESHGPKTIVTSGEGVELRISVNHIPANFLKHIADDKKLSNNPGNYHGVFEGFLEPFVQPFDTAVIIDKRLKDRNGKYFVESVEGSFSAKGGRQKVSIGIRLPETKIT